MAAFLGENTGHQSELRDERGAKLKKWDLIKEEYQKQAKSWPALGKHILAHYDDETVVVYQAYNPQIAQYAVKYQKFGGPDFSYQRMSWIKTNFMWMMFRCGWAQKKNQERVLAVWLTRNGFESILSMAKTGKQSDPDTMKSDEVRLQWDPDHDPHGGKLNRRAIQLGLRGKALQDYGTRHVVNIKDITDFVHQQFHVLSSKDNSSSLLCPRERVYTPQNYTCAQIDLDFVSQQTVVSFTS